MQESTDGRQIEEMNQGIDRETVGRSSGWAAIAAVTSATVGRLWWILPGFLAGLGGVVNSGWVHWVHGLSPWFLGFGWVMLLLAQYWNRSRHHGGGVPWVLSVLWLATWVTLANTAIFGVEEGLVGHEEIVLGVNWPHLLQTGTAVTFLVLMAVNFSTVVGLGRVDLGMWSGRMLGARRWRAYALGHLVNLTVGLALAAGIAVLLSGLS